jgi:hypothetical protein
LQAQTIREIARADTCRIKAMDQGQHGLHPLEINAQPVSDLIKRITQIASLVDEIDQRCADHPVDRIGGGDMELFG